MSALFIVASLLFPLIAPDGTRVEAAGVLAGDRKVVVYVSPELEPGGRLIAAVRGWSQDDPARWRERVVVIVAAPVSDAREWLQAQWGADQLPAWFADPDAAAWRALGFQGNVAVAGLADAAVEWKLDGVIADPAVVELPLRTWIHGGGR